MWPVEPLESWVTVPDMAMHAELPGPRITCDGGNGSTIEWSVSAESFRKADAAILEQDATASAIIRSLDRYIGSWRQSMIDVNGESVDLSHMCVTTLGYLNGLVVPDTWTGWAGDLGSAMSNIQKAKDWNPQASIDVIAEALVGADDNYRQQGALQGPYA